MAAATSPKFKVRWLKDERRRDAVQTMLISECRGQTPPEEPLIRPADQSPATSSHNGFF